MQDSLATSRPHASESRRLGWALAITATFMALEVAGGLISGSLALLADAGHMLTDTAALGLAWIAARLAARPTNPRRSYGYHRAQVLAAFVNALALFVVVVWIVFEAAQRLATPRPIEGATMLGIACAGLAANLAVYRDPAARQPGQHERGRRAPARARRPARFAAAHCWPPR